MRRIFIWIVLGMVVIGEEDVFVYRGLGLSKTCATVVELWQDNVDGLVVFLVH